MKSKIIVAYHKRYEAPKNQLYIPLQVGKANSKVTLDMMGDNQGKNISSPFLEFIFLYSFTGGKKPRFKILLRSFFQL